MKIREISRRKGWKAEAVESGFAHAAASWIEGAAAVFTRAEYESLKAACLEVDRLHAEMAVAAASDDRLLRLAGIPESMHDYMAGTTRGGECLVARYDFAFPEDGVPRLIDANTDSWFGLAQSAAMQWTWIEQHLAAGNLHPDDDQFNLLDEGAIGWFGRIPSVFPVHFAAPMADPEAALACAWLVNCAIQAGHQCRPMDIVSLGAVDEVFVDPVGDRVHTLVKLYPWHEMLREEGAEILPVSRTRFADPAWTALMSNRALHAVLWAENPGHPNLVETRHAVSGRDMSGDWIWKPSEGRVDLADRRSLAWPDGGILQRRVPLARTPAGLAMVSVWTVGGEPSGIGVFVERAVVGGVRRGFLPHIVTDRFEN